jgi:flagellar basal body-associated protein FliL
MFPADEENILLIIAGTIMFLMLGIFIIAFLFFYQKKRNHPHYRTGAAEIGF